MPSTLTFPGPTNNRTKYAVKNNAGVMPLPKTSPLNTLNKATDMVMISGMEANLVNNPSIRKSEQKNSAKTTSASDMVDPIPKKLIKGGGPFRTLSKWVSFS